MEPLRRQNLSELVAARIKHLIIEQGLKPGDRLPTEQEMAARFAVSRVSVREATKALSFLGIIRAAPRRGLTVGHVDMQRVTEYLGFHLALSDYPSTQLLQTRIVIESGALPFVVDSFKTDPALYQTLIELIDGALRANNVEERIQHDIAFHRALLEASGVAPLVAFHDLLQIFFARFRGRLSDDEQAWQHSAAQHRRLVDCLRDGDTPQAQQALVEHLNHYWRHST